METTTPERKFHVVYADPPWDIQQKGGYGAERHYDLMTIERIKAMGTALAPLVADDAVLLLWTTNAALPQALDVIQAWGFKYSTNAAWDKYYMGLGQTFRGSHELLLVGTRGRVKVKFRGQRSTLHFPRQDHSHKPEEMFPLIERMFDGPYLELFARRRPNTLADWSVWGNEIPSDVKLPGYPVATYSERAGGRSVLRSVTPNGGDDDDDDTDTTDGEAA